ncbi:hypothetical protein RB213_009575 [Colletotrichum asianum]
MLSRPMTTPAPFRHSPARAAPQTLRASRASRPSRFHPTSPDVLPHSRRPSCSILCASEHRADSLFRLHAFAHAASGCTTPPKSHKSHGRRTTGH